MAPVLLPPSFTDTASVFDPKALIAWPLYPPDAWPSYYGQIGWTDQFSWASA